MITRAGASSEEGERMPEITSASGRLDGPVAMSNSIATSISAPSPATMSTRRRTSLA